MINIQTIGIQVLAAEPAAPSAWQGAMQLLMMLLFGAAIYFFMIAPHNKRQKELAKMQSELAVGDDVVLSNGIYGRIAHIKDDRVTLELESGRMVVMKTSIFGKAEDAAKAVQA